MSAFDVIEQATDTAIVSRSLLARAVDQYAREHAWRVYKHTQAVRVGRRWARRNRKRYAVASALPPPGGRA